MFEHFSEDEIERMSAFTETPAYKRTPEQLLPEEAREATDEGGESTETPSPQV